MFLVLSWSKNLREGCKVQLIPVPSFRKDTFQRSGMVSGCITFWQLRLFHALVKQIISDEQTF